MSLPFATTESVAARELGSTAVEVPVHKLQQNSEEWRPFSRRRFERLCRGEERSWIQDQGNATVAKDGAAGYTSEVLQEAAERLDHHFLFRHHVVHQQRGSPAVVFDDDNDAFPWIFDRAGNRESAVQAVNRKNLAAVIEHFASAVNGGECFFLR